MAALTFIPTWNRDFSIKCEACGNVAYHRHHIHYGRSPLVSLLCIPCHKSITKINTDAGWEKRASLTISERMHIFDKFLGHKRDNSSFDPDGIKYKWKMPTADEINWNSRLG